MSRPTSTQRTHHCALPTAVNPGNYPACRALNTNPVIGSRTDGIRVLRKLHLSCFPPVLVTRFGMSCSICHSATPRSSIPIPCLKRFFCSLHTYHTGVSNPPGRYGDPVKCSTWKELFSCVSFCSSRGLHLSYSLLLPQGIINAGRTVGSGCCFGYARFDFISFFVSVVWLVARCFTLGTMLGVNKEYDWCINFSPRMQRKFLPCIFVGVIVV